MVTIYEFDRSPERRFNAIHREVYEAAKAFYRHPLLEQREVVKDDIPHFGSYLRDPKLDKIIIRKDLAELDQKRLEGYPEFMRMKRLHENNGISFDAEHLLRDVFSHEYSHAVFGELYIEDVAMALDPKKKLLVDERVIDLKSEGEFRNDPLCRWRKEDMTVSTPIIRGIDEAFALWGQDMIRGHSHRGEAGDYFVEGLITNHVFLYFNLLFNRIGRKRGPEFVVDKLVEIVKGNLRD